MRRKNATGSGRMQGGKHRSRFSETRERRRELITRFPSLIEPLERRLMLNAAVAASPSVVAATSSVTPTITWVNPAGGFWDVASNWSTGVVPASTDDVSINEPGNVTITFRQGNASVHSISSSDLFAITGGTLTVATTVEVDNTFTLSSGTLQSTTVLPGSGGQGLTASGGTLDGVTLNSNLAVSGNTGVTVLNGLTLNGTATLGNSSNSTGGYLSFTGSQTLGGTGSVVFGSSSQYNALVATATGPVPNPLLTIGSGITVSGQTGFLGYDTFTGIGQTTSVINDGTIQWSTGTNISVPNTLTNDGTITVNSTGVFAIGGTLSGGTLTTQTGALINGGKLDNVTISGNFGISGNSGVTILDSLTLNGTATLGNSSNSTGGYLSFTGSQTLGGTGSVIFGSSSQYNALVATATGPVPNPLLTIGSGITVSGQTGFLGYDTFTGIGQTTSVINDGTIQWSTGTNISVPNTLTNDGTITVNSTGVFAIGGTLSGGTLTTQTGALINGGKLDNVTISGNFGISGNSGVTILDSLTLNGTATLGNSSNSTGGYLSFTGSQTLGGTGSVIFGSSSQYNALVATATGPVPNPLLTIGSGITVSGQTGFLGYDTFTGIGQTTSVINDGTIQWSTGTNISVPNTLTNDGTITVNSTGVFAIGGTLSGGTLTTQTGALINGGKLDNVTISGNFGISGNSGVTILDSLTLNGTATLGNSSNSTGGYLSFTGSQTLGGTGSVVFGSSSQYNALVATATGPVPNPLLTIGSGITVSGQTGVLGYDSFTSIGASSSVVNQGTIQASVSGGTVSVNTPSNAFNNLGSVVASSGTLAITAGGSGVVNNGSVTAGPTGAINITGNFSQPSIATFNVVLGGATTNLYGHVTVSGSATLDGTFNVNEVNGFSPGTGNIFKVLTFTNESGQFADYTGLTLAGGAALQPSYDPTDVSLTTVTSTTIAPDLRVSNITLTPSTPQSGQQVTIDWNDQNAGNGSTPGSWTDHIVVVNTTTAQTIATLDVPYDAAVNGSIAAGGRALRSANIRLPDGPAGAGNLSISITVDYYNTIAEYYPGNVGETNNTTTISAASTLAAYPDLQVTGLGVVPTNPQSGQSVTINWNDANNGSGAATGNWYDAVTVVNTTTNQTLISTTFAYNSLTSGSIGAEGFTAQSFMFQVPNGSAGVGQLSVTVTANATNSLFEYNGSGTATTNNTASINVTSTLAAYADLAPSGVTAPPTLPPGQQVTVGWTLSNLGGTTAIGPWTEQILLATDAAGDNPILLTAVTDPGPLPAGQQVSRSASVQIPSFLAGNYWVVINENPYNQVFETNTANNTAVAASPSTIPVALTLTLASHSVSNAAGPNATTATVTRNGTTTNSLQVSIASSDPNDVSVPASITMPAGQSSVTFSVGAINQGLVQGPQTATLIASAAGATSASDTLTVTDSQLAGLAVSLNIHSISESATNPAAMATVTRNTPTTNSLVVSLVSNAPNKLQVPATVTIPAGQASATFPVTVVNDQQIDGDATATISASAAGFTNGSDSATVLDVNIPTMTLTLADQTVSEAGGVMATTGTVTLGAPAITTVIIGLSSSDPTAATVVVPQVIINAGASSAMFAISAVDDGLDLGNKSTTISAQFVTVQGTVLTANSVSENLTVLEHDGPALSISLPVAAIAPGGTALATVTRNTSTIAPLTVSLSSSDTTHATVPASVIIPAGQNSTTFLITGVNDNLPDGEQFASITASSSGFDSAITRIGVTSVNLPDLVVTNVTAPASAHAGSTAQVSWTVINNGLYPGAGPWTDQIYLDPTDGGSGGGLIDTVTFSGTLAAGASYTQTDTITLPTASGHYGVRIVTDTAQDLQELSFNNNSFTSAQLLGVTAPYIATVSTSLTGPVSNGTPVILSGRASLSGSGQPAAKVSVAVYVTSGGLTRTLTATTDSSGNYSTTFQPFPLETGTYSIAAGYPGAPFASLATAGQFTIVGISANPSFASVRVQVGTPLNGQITVTNLGATDLSGISAVAQGGPAALTVQLNVASTLAGSGQTTLSYTLSAGSGGGTTGTVVLHITSAEGAVLDIPINVALIATTPVLVLDPTYLNAGMLVGQQTLVSFQVSNNGGAASGDVQVLPPNAPYLSLASAATIPSIAPGQSATVTVALSPPANFALGQYTGTIALNYGGTGLSIPYTFNAISSAVGDVQIIVDDIFTFNGSGAPRVAGATVQLLDPYDNSHVIATGSSNSDGLATITAVPAGQYVLQVSATDHDTYRTSFTVTPGITNVGEVFLLNQLVTYNWVVTPTTISDQYSIKLQTSFLTEVPAPVVTITGPDQIPTLQPGQSAQMDIVVTNHGLIAAQGVSITLPTDPEYTFTAPTTVLGTVPAMSSVTVPVMVSRSLSAAARLSVPSAAPATGGNATPADNSSSPCTVYVPATYFVICGGIKHELTTSLTLEINGRVCNALGIVAGFLASLFGGGGGGGLTIQLPPIYIIPAPPGTALPPNQPPRQFPTDDVPTPPAVQNPSNCDPLAELVGALAAKALAGPVIDPINALFGGLNLANGLLNGHPSTSPLEYGEALAGAGVGGTAGQLFGTLAGMGQTLNESGYPVPGFSSSPEAAAAISPALSSTELKAALSGAYTSTLRIQDLLRPDVYFFGSADWVQTTQSGTAGQWIGSFLSDTGDTADGSINATDRAQLLALTLPDTVTLADANAFLDRWNRTVAYADQGIFTTAQVPAGQSTDFIDEGNLATLVSQANAALLASQGDGFTDPVAELHAQLQQFINTINDQSVCATIKLEIDQTAALTRSAFNGTLQITNDETSGPLSNIQLDLSVTDANGNPVNGKFFISSPTLSGQLTGVDGTGSIPIGGSGSVSYTFIPTDDAAPSTPTLYFIGGTFSYLDPDSGTEVVTPIYPAAITVYPQAKLQLNYFLQKDAIGDDPSTPQIEPSEPAVLGVLVKNIGGGTANQLSITTAQPQIVENEKGLLVNFQIIGTQVGTQAVTPSLTVNFGDILPGQVGDASFLLLSSLQGEFQDFSATFTHSDALGGMDTSLISSVQTHELTHAGDFVFPGSDGETSYLVNDVPDPQSMPDTVYLSNGSTAPVNLATNIAVTGAVSSTGPSVLVTATVSSGWTYLQVPDPGAGYVLARVVRSDGMIIPVSDMAWTTDRTIASTGKATVDDELHILDLNSTGSYTVYYRPANATAPSVVSLQPIPSPQSGAVSSVDVIFNEPIDPTTFNWQNVTLSLNGGPNLITSAVTLAQDSPTTFTINNLSALTGNPGNYSLNVSASGVSDFFGDAGTGSLSQTWATGTNIPVIISVGAGDPALRNTALQSTLVVLSEAIVPSSFDYHALTLTRDGGSNMITSAVTVTRVNDTTYSINGLSALTAEDGSYVLSVNAGTLVDGAARSGVGTLSESWVTSTVSPTIASLQQASKSPRNIIVPTLNVTFSEPIDPTTFTWQSITYSKQGGPNLIDTSITITQLSPTEFQIGNFNHLIAPVDGDYTFAVSAAAIRDLYGNFGIGTTSASWTLDTTAPDAPSTLAITPDTGASPTDDVTDTGAVTLTGTVSEPGLVVEVYDGLTSKLADAVVTGTTFSAALNLGSGAHSLRVYAVDPAANVSASTTLSVYINSTPLSATFAPIVQSSPQQAVSSEQLTFTEALNATTFDFHSLTLTQNGGPNLIDGSVTVQHLSGDTYEIDGLAPLSSSIGQYQLVLNPNFAQDQAGNTTGVPVSISWQVAAPIQAAVFSNLSASRSIFFGIPTSVFSGRVAGASTLAGGGETVGITINGLTAQAPINAQGNFAVSFVTAALPPSATPYTVTYSYGGDAALTAVTDSTSTTLTVNRAPPVLILSALAGGFTYNGSGGVTSALSVTLAGFAGAAAPSGSATIFFYEGPTPTGTPLGSPPVNAGTYTAIATYPGDTNYTPAQSTPLKFTIDRAAVTVALPSPPANLTYDGTSSVTAWVKAAVTGPAGAPPPSGPVLYSYYAGNSATNNAISSPPVNAGTYTVVANYAGNGNYLAGQSAPVTFTISQPTAPLSVFFKVDDGTPQRSMVRSLTVTFTSPVTLQPGAIALADGSGNSVLFTLSTSDNAVYTLTFTGGQFTGGSLSDGQYELTVDLNLVSGGISPLVATQRSFSFWRLFGDFYGTDSVNNADKVLFTQAYKGLAPADLSYFDHDGSGVLDSTDVNAFNQNFGKSIGGALSLDTVVGTGGADTITLAIDPDLTHVDWTLGAATVQLPINDPNGLTINGNGGSDVLVLDYSRGNPLPGTLHLNGTFTIYGLQGSPGAPGLANTNLDINRSTVYISYADAASDPLAAIRSYLSNGFNTGGWNGTANANAGAITSAAASQNAAQTTGIGYADSADGLIPSQPANTIELKYTLYGDTGLTGSVGFNDFTRLTQHYNQTSGGGWDTGDFSYDGSVNFSDFTLMTRTYGTSLGSQASPAAAAAGSATQATAPAGSAGTSAANTVEAVAAAQQTSKTDNVRPSRRTVLTHANVNVKPAQQAPETKTFRRKRK